MNRLKQLIDSTGVLPEVTFIPQTMADRNLGLHEIYWDGLMAGRAAVRMDNQSERYFSSIAIDPKYRRKGIGLSTYITAIETAQEYGETFRSNSEFSKGAAAIWQKFILAGLAEVVEPLEKIVHDFGDAAQVSYKGYIRVNPDLHT